MHTDRKTFLILTYSAEKKNPLSVLAVRVQNNVN